MPADADLDTIATQDARSALDMILQSGSFARSPKVSRLLSYLVERRLAEDNPALKEGAIARNVFDQPGDFNPRSNPIVRVNASRLRGLLRLYYAGPGRSDPVRILLPDIGYRPDLSLNREPGIRPGEDANTMHAHQRGAGEGKPGAGPDDIADAANAAMVDAGSKTADGGWRAPGSPPERAGDAHGVAMTASPLQRATSRYRRGMNRYGLLVLVLANLTLAGAFVVMAENSDASGVAHVLHHVAPDSIGNDDKAVLVLCDPKEGSGPADAIAMQIGAKDYACWPLRLRQAAGDVASQ